MHANILATIGMVKTTPYDCLEPRTPTPKKWDSKGMKSL